MRIGIIGGGFSGVISSLFIKGNNEITILERNNDILKKLLITGNGRCNYFNKDMNINHFHSNNEEYLKDIITKENIDKLNKFYKDLGIIPKIKNGYYYPYSNKASSIKDLLICELKNKKIKIKCDYLVDDIKIKNNKFIINNELEFDKIIISTGGMAYPKTGSDGNIYNLLKKFNHTITDIYPSLVQITSNNKYLKELSGVRCESTLSLYDNKLIKEEKGELQFTNYGVSGICTFNLSSYLKGDYKNKYILVNFMPINEDELNKFMIKNNYKTILSSLEGILNNKLIKVILKLSDIKEDACYLDLNSKQKEVLFDNLFRYKVNITGTKGFNDAQVTSGGVSIDEINMITMESKLIPNLYIVGELLDIDGDCGGYNLTNAFITGMVAGENI